MSNAIEVRNVSKIIVNQGRKIVILKDISLDIEKGKVTAIIGKSGSGKTTLLSIMSGIDTPTAGTVKVLDKDFYRLKSTEQDVFRNKNIGLLFQNYHLIPELTCEENIRMPLCFSKERKDRKEIDDWMKKIGMESKKNLFPRQMSGGEQQRAAILRAIVNNPEVIFADEPTGALDSSTGDKIIKFLINYSHKSNKTIVLVTHDMDIANQCDRIIEITDGSLK